MSPLFRWWAWLALWQRSQVAFLIVWTLFWMFGAGYMHYRFQEEHEDNLRLQRIFYDHTGKLLK